MTHDGTFLQKYDCLVRYDLHIFLSQKILLFNIAHLAHFLFHLNRTQKLTEKYQFWTSKTIGVAAFTMTIICIFVNLPHAHTQVGVGVGDC